MPLSKYFYPENNHCFLTWTTNKHIIEPLSTNKNLDTKSHVNIQIIYEFASLLGHSVSVVLCVQISSLY